MKSNEFCRPALARGSVIENNPLLPLPTYSIRNPHSAFGRNYRNEVAKRDFFEEYVQF
jgi:hypothetical protein